MFYDVMPRLVLDIITIVQGTWLIFPEHLCRTGLSTRPFKWDSDRLETHYRLEHKLQPCKFR